MSISSAVIAVATLGTLLASTHSLAAQQAPGSPGKTWELRITDGKLIATGAQRHSLQDAQMTTAQISWAVRPSLAVTGTFGWARSRDVGSINTPKLDVFTSDLGVETRPIQLRLSRRTTLRPFVGVGAGVRSYNYRSLDVDATHNLAAYGAAGAELGIGRAALRLEVRDYTTGFKPLTGGGSSEVRNDMAVTLGLRFHRHAASQE